MDYEMNAVTDGKSEKNVIDVVVVASEGTCRPPKMAGKQNFPAIFDRLAVGVEFSLYSSFESQSSVF